tara:strand:+ start:199 stop:396 length:198 start_codon:yes stop_codon:yes gene_type:complete
MAFSVSAQISLPQFFIYLIICGAGLGQKSFPKNKLSSKYFIMFRKIILFCQSQLNIAYGRCAMAP